MENPAEPDATEDPWSYVPLAPKTLAETGIPEAFLRELLLKTVWAYDSATPGMMANGTGLHLTVVDELISGLSHEGLCEIETKSAQGAAAQFQYRLTDRGKNAARDALERSRYVGVAPVPISAYNKIVEEQIHRFQRPPLHKIRNALDHLVLPERLIEVLGQAFFSRRALMVYGPSGNGKTDLVTSISEVIIGTVVIPYALFGHGQLIRVFDPDVHISKVDEEPEDAGNKSKEANIWAGAAFRHDRRWLPIDRPNVMVGGEMGAEALDMTYDATQGVHNAPLSIVAQGGVLVIDDLGRQKISPKEILNRWVMMMEQGFDSFALGSSEIVRLPLDVTLVFSTNLTVQELLDEAYLRRIAYKIEIPGPDREAMLKITQRSCERTDIEWSEFAAKYFVDKVFAPGMPEPRGCYPRDIITTIIDEADFQGRPPVFDRQSIDVACTLYFGVTEAAAKDAA